MKTLLATLVLMGSVCVFAAGAERVHVYSSRHYGGDRPLWEACKASTGLDVVVMEGESDGVLARVQREGAGCIADVMILTDAGNLGRAVELGLFRPLGASPVFDRVPEAYRHEDRLWVGLGRRHRILVYHPDRVSEDELPDMMDLALPVWKGRVIARSSGNIYNQSLLASIIAHHGLEAAEAWASGVRANMARAPEGNDRAQIAAVAAGLADVAIVNHYYVEMMRASENPAERRAGELVRMHFPDQASGKTGAHTNITGAGRLVHAPNPDAAQRLIEWLLTSEAQALFVKPSHEYPIRTEPVDGGSAGFRADDLKLSELGRLNVEAVKLFDRVGWR